MNALMVILTLILSGEVYASDVSFQQKEIRELIEASEQLNECILKNVKNCKIGELEVADASPVEEKEITASRLIPVDRSKNALLNIGTGRLAVDFINYGGQGNRRVGYASAVKISSCHIVTSAHAVFKNGSVPKDLDKLNEINNLPIKFYSEQTLQTSSPFGAESVGKVIFNMLDKKGDYECLGRDAKNNCINRGIDGQSDVIIIKLAKGGYVKNDQNYFKPDIAAPVTGPEGKRITCTAYPIYNESMSSKITVEQSNTLAWQQTDAKYFAPKGFVSAKGVLTNAVAYKGMSGGGCTSAAGERNLVGIYANNNGGYGHSAVNITLSNARASDPNFLTTFNRLAARFSAKNPGKTLADLESECE